jgi:hypothetical protein
MEFYIQAVGPEAGKITADHLNKVIGDKYIWMKLRVSKKITRFIIVSTVEKPFTYYKLFEADIVCDGFRLLPFVSGKTGIYVKSKPGVTTEEMKKSITKRGTEYPTINYCGKIDFIDDDSNPVFIILVSSRHVQKFMNMLPIETIKKAIPYKQAHPVFSVYITEKDKFLNFPNLHSTIVKGYQCFRNFKIKVLKAYLRGTFKHDFVKIGLPFYIYYSQFERRQLIANIDCEEDQVIEELEEDNANVQDRKKCMQNDKKLPRNRQEMAKKSPKNHQKMDNKEQNNKERVFDELLDSEGIVGDLRSFMKEMAQDDPSNYNREFIVSVLEQVCGYEVFCDLKSFEGNEVACKEVFESI